MKKKLHKFMVKEWTLRMYMILYLLFAIVITYVWKAMDIAEFGRDMVSMADSFFALLLIFSLIFNIALFRYIKLGKI